MQDKWNKHFFKGWWINRFEEAGLSEGEVADELGLSLSKLTRFIHNQDSWSLEEIKKIADVLGLHWWQDILYPFRRNTILTTKIGYDEIKLAMLEEEGEVFDRIAEPAA